MNPYFSPPNAKVALPPPVLMSERTTDVTVETIVDCVTNIYSEAEDNINYVFGATKRFFVT